MYFKKYLHLLDTNVKYLNRYISLYVTTLYPVFGFYTSKNQVFSKRLSHLIERKFSRVCHHCNIILVLAIAFNGFLFSSVKLLVVTHHLQDTIDCLMVGKKTADESVDVRAHPEIL